MYFAALLFNADVLGLLLYWWNDNVIICPSLSSFLYSLVYLI